ncbi:MAG: response regulator transcription factor [Jatrophihabitans sp.]
MTEKSERASIPIEPVPVLIVEDHPIFREGLAQTVADHAGLHLIGTASSVERIDWDAVTAADNLVVLLDLNLPGKSGAAAVAYLVQTGARVVVVSAQESRDTVLDALAAGARGYVTKSSESSEIHRAIHTVAAGHTFVSATLASYLLTAARPDPEEQLTPQEQRVLTLLARGERDQDIADHLGIAVRTVRSHLERIRDKTGRRRRVELAQLANDTNTRP